MDRYTKCILTIIAAALVAIAANMTIIAAALVAIAANMTTHATATSETISVDIQKIAGRYIQGRSLPVDCQK